MAKMSAIKRLELYRIHLEFTFDLGSFSKEVTVAAYNRLESLEFVLSPDRPRVHYEVLDNMLMRCKH